MDRFSEILHAPGEELVRKFYVYQDDFEPGFNDERTEIIAMKLGLRREELIVAVGFNPHINECAEILPIIGFKSMDDLAKERNEIFISDIYRKINLEQILEIYSNVKEFPKMLQVMQYLAEHRLKNIETKIEETVNSALIEKYKVEMKTIYMDGIAGIDFAENRLGSIDSGFRALLNEVTIITESRVIPAGDIFFRNTILPEEKRKLLNRGLIPLELVEARLEDVGISSRERKILEDYIKMNKQNSSGNN